MAPIRLDKWGKVDEYNSGTGLFCRREFVRAKKKRGREREREREMITKGSERYKIVEIVEREEDVFFFLLL